MITDKTKRELNSEWRSEMKDVDVEKAADLGDKITEILNGNNLVDARGALAFAVAEILLNIKRDEVRELNKFYLMVDDFMVFTKQTMLLEQLENDNESKH